MRSIKMTINGSRVVLVCLIMMFAANLAIADTPSIRWLVNLPNTSKAVMGQRYETQHAMKSTRVDSIVQSFEKMLSTKKAGNVGKIFSKRKSSKDGQFTYISDRNEVYTLEFDHKAGALMFRNTTLEDGELRTTPNLPDRRKAPAQAKAHLKALKLLPDRFEEMVVEHIGGEAMGELNRDGTTTIYDKLRTVRFGRRVNGLPVRGPGSRIVVQLGEDGQLASLVRVWSQIRSESPRKSVTPETFNSKSEVRNMITKRTQAVAEEARGIEIRQIELVLFDDEQGVIEPAYYVVAARIYDTEDIKPTLPVGKKGINPDSGEKKLAVTEDFYDFYVPLLKSSRAHFPDVYVIDDSGKARLTPSDIPMPDEDVSIGRQQEYDDSYKSHLSVLQDEEVVSSQNFTDMEKLGDSELLLKRTSNFQSTVDGKELNNRESKVQFSNVPEPTTLVLFGVGLMGMLTCLRKKLRR